MSAARFVNADSILLSDGERRVNQVLRDKPCLRLVRANYIRDEQLKAHWGSTDIRDVRTVAVENSLRQLQRQDGEALANSTKAKIRNLMSVLFNHGIRYDGWNKDVTAGLRRSELFALK